MGLLEFIGGTRGKLQGYRDVTRAKMLQPVLDKFGRDAEEQRIADAAEAMKGGNGRSGILSQFGPETAQQLGPLLTSDNPQQQALGSSLLGQLVGAKAAPKGLPFDERMMTPAQRVQAGDQRTQWDQEQALRVSADERDQLRTVAYVNNLSYDNAMKANAQSLAALQTGLKSEGDLRGEYQKAPVMVKGVQAMGSWQMLKRSLDQNNEMALQSAIVAAAQIQEPGLAVRNDDRIAYSGNNPVVDRLVQTFNTAMSGEGLTEGVKQRLLALGTQLAGVHANNILQVTDEYRKLAINTPGARMDQVTAGSGVDWDTVQFLAEMTRQDRDRKGPGGR